MSLPKGNPNKPTGALISLKNFMKSPELYNLISSVKNKPNIIGMPETRLHFLKIWIHSMQC